MIKEALAEVVNGRNLKEAEMVEVMDEVMEGKATPAQIAAFITALRVKGETVDEVTGAARVMRQKATRIDARSSVIVDTCGTGGDGRNTFNISTTAAFVVAAAGITVAKHGNRAVSSGSGSADVLEALGVVIDLAPVGVTRCIAEAGDRVHVRAPSPPCDEACRRRTAGARDGDDVQPRRAAHEPGVRAGPGHGRLRPGPGSARRHGAKEFGRRKGPRGTRRRGP